MDVGLILLLACLHTNSAVIHITSRSAYLYATKHEDHHSVE